MGLHRITERALQGAASFLESWPGAVSMWLALAAYCYL